MCEAFERIDSEAERIDRIQRRVGRGELRFHPRLHGCMNATAAPGSANSSRAPSQDI